MFRKVSIHEDKSAKPSNAPLDLTLDIKQK